MAPRFVLAVLLLALSSAEAQVSYSYYDPSEAAVRQLRTVEQYHFGKGMARMEAREWRLAMAEWDFILRYFPDHPRVLYLMSSTSIKANLGEQAEEYFRNAMALNARNASTHAIYGIHLYSLNKLDDAIEAFQQSLSLDPMSAETHYNLGIAYAAAGKLAAANRHAQAAYNLGYPLPGLRDKLRRMGAWSTLTQPELEAVVSLPE
jgi:predicted Zn-dependent protease